MKNPPSRCFSPSPSQVVGDLIRVKITAPPLWLETRTVLKSVRLGNFRRDVRLKSPSSGSPWIWHLSDPSLFFPTSILDRSEDKQHFIHTFLAPFSFPLLSFPPPPRDKVRTYLESPLRPRKRRAELRTLEFLGLYFLTLFLRFFVLEDYPRYSVANLNTIQYGKIYFRNLLSFFFMSP